MENNTKISIMLIGAGYMAIEYSRVLNAMDIPIIVVGRGEESAKNFKKETNLDVITGGVKKWLERSAKYPEYAIVASTGTELGKVTRLLLAYGIKKILVEKPGGLNLEDIEEVARICEKKKSDVLIAYNRRFYASVRKAREIIRKDGGILSAFFEFTEWSHVIADIDKKIEIKHRWVLHNSSHVIDLAFYLCGEPKEIHSFITGDLPWHPSGATFTGAGITENGVLFSYHSNWDAPGRWGLEILTRNFRLIFRPIEKLQIQKKGNLAIEEVKIDEKLDQDFKPGLFRQVKAFLRGDKSDFIDIYQQLSRAKIYKKMSNEK